MISISPELEAAIASPDRMPQIKMVLDWTDVYVGAANTATTNSQNTMCGVGATITDAARSQVHDTVTTTPYKWIVNDGTWVNDGSFYWAPGTIAELSNNQLGWHSGYVADGAGDFSTAPTLTVDFGEDRAISTILVVGDPTIDQYPVDFTVTVYDVGDSVVGTPEVVTGNADVSYTADFSSDDITDARYIVLEIDKWSDADTTAKITEFFGVITDTLYGDNIISIDHLEEIESDGGASPRGFASINEINVELQNIKMIRADGDEITDPYLPDNASSPFNNSITPNVRVDVYYGFILPDTSTEWIYKGAFWITEWDVSETAFPARFTARDRMDILRRNTFRLDEVLINNNFYQIAEAVLNHAKINIPLNDLEWNISSDLLSYYVPYTWFGEVTYFEALSLIA